MAKKKINYANTSMYKLVCNDLSVKDVYVGHTTLFRTRKSMHKTKCNNVNDASYNLLVYRVIRENGGWDAWQMIEIEKYPCNDENESTSRERHWYELLKATMNFQVPNRSIKEWKLDNKDHVKEVKKEYESKNKEQIRERKKKSETCICGSIIRSCHRSKHLETQVHLDFVRLQEDPTYSTLLPNQLKCPCGGQYFRPQQSRHYKSLKHITFMQNQLDLKCQECCDENAETVLLQGLSA